MINNMNGMYQNQAYYMNQGYGSPVRMPKRKNVLTDAQIASLNKSANLLEFTDEEILQNSCDHISNQTGGFALNEYTPLGGNGAKCEKCGEKFRLVDDSVAVAADNNQYTVDLLNTIQTYGVEIDEALKLEIGKIKAFVKKIPKMYEAVMLTWNQKYAQYVTNNQAMGGGDNVKFYDYVMSGAIPMSNPSLMNQNLQNAGFYMNQQPMGYQQPPMYQEPMMGGYNQQPPMYQEPMMGGYNQMPQVPYPSAMQQQAPQMNMNMNYPAGGQVTNNNSFFSSNTGQQQMQQQPAYSQPPVGVVQQQAQAQQVGTQQVQQQYTPPTVKKDSDVVDPKPVATKPMKA